MTSTFEEEIRHQKSRYERIATELTNGYGFEAICDLSHHVSERLALIREIESLVRENGVEHEAAISQILMADVREYNTLARRDDHSDGMMLSPDWSRYKELSNRIDFINDLNMAANKNPPHVHAARIYHQDCGRCQGVVYMPSAFGPSTLYQATVYECKNPDCRKATFTIDENDRHFYRDMNKLRGVVD